MVGVQYVLAKVAASKQKHANGASEVALSDPFRPSQSTHLWDG
jgi:hypothetical protein